MADAKITDTLSDMLFALTCIQILKSRQPCEEDEDVTEAVVAGTLDGQTVRKSRRVSFADMDEVRSVTVI